MARRGDAYLISCWVDEDLYKQVEDAHWDTRLSRADWVREAIREKLARDRGDRDAQV
jgi:metal-responsive CopG/Arc/MetJ family transcriptional regulator